MRHHEGNYNGCFFERQHGACCNVHYLPGAGHTSTHPTPNPSLLLEKTSGLAAGSVFTGRRAGWLWVTKFPDKPGHENGHLLVLREMEYSTVGTITRSFTNHLDRVSASGFTFRTAGIDSGCRVAGGGCVLFLNSKPSFVFPQSQNGRRQLELDLTTSVLSLLSRASV